MGENFKLFGMTGFILLFYFNPSFFKQMTAIRVDRGINLEKYIYRKCVFTRYK